MLPKRPKVNNTRYLDMRLVFSENSYWHPCELATCIGNFTMKGYLVSISEEIILDSRFEKKYIYNNNDISLAIFWRNLCMCKQFLIFISVMMSILFN